MRLIWSVLNWLAKPSSCSFAPATADAKPADVLLRKSASACLAHTHRETESSRNPPASSGKDPAFKKKSRDHLVMSRPPRRPEPSAEETTCVMKTEWFLLQLRLSSAATAKIVGYKAGGWVIPIAEAGAASVAELWAPGSASSKYIARRGLILPPGRVTRPEASAPAWPIRQGRWASIRP